MRHLLAAALVALTLAACSSEPAVAWTDYPSGLQQSIDGTGDCRELQGLFDAYADMNDAQRTRTGEGTGDVLDYIDNRLDEAGCYG